MHVAISGTTKHQVGLIWMLDLFVSQEEIAFDSGGANVVLAGMDAQRKQLPGTVSFCSLQGKMILQTILKTLKKEIKCVICSITTKDTQVSSFYILKDFSFTKIIMFSLAQERSIN